MCLYDELQHTIINIARCNDLFNMNIHVNYTLIVTSDWYRSEPANKTLFNPWEKTDWVVVELRPATTWRTPLSCYHAHTFSLLSPLPHREGREGIFPPLLLQPTTNQTCDSGTPKNRVRRQALIGRSHERVDTQSGVQRSPSWPKYPQGRIRIGQFCSAAFTPRTTDF